MPLGPERKVTHSMLDQPEVLRVLFYPRREYGLASHALGVRPVAVEVEPGIAVGGRLYPADAEAPAILFFHGNGETARDYDMLAGHNDIQIRAGAAYFDQIRSLLGRIA